ncbi:protein tyrosine/serine phosphatase [Silvimonas terrae]|uniref:Protein tyrosine/serine phosphatase n=1 Tax=Silvimonas terrae TaxID=300266 RepID=A0A840RBV8_9NEIS|nr:dual specificity protein phosphatase family protein [Silvimonas terrae]MBB5190835.1 protein tyrosine/serine phosphatase [Silvimonas terrae]
MPSVSQADASRNPAWAVPVFPARNLYRVTSLLYRSAQPEPEDAKLIQSLGIRTIISFRANHDDAHLDFPGVKRVRVPMDTWHIGDPEIVAALQAIRAAQKEGPVLIHCHHGADRTGIVTAMYRMTEQGWSRERALDELRNGHYGFHEIWFNIPHYLMNVDLTRLHQELLTTPAG